MGTFFYGFGGTFWERKIVVWVIVDGLCHPDDLPGVGISSGWVMANSLCHADDILFHFMSPGWLNWGWFPTWMSYGNVIMSSGWDTLLFLSHPGAISPARCRFQPVLPGAALRRNWSGWDNKSWFSTTRGGPSALPYHATRIRVQSFQQDMDDAIY